MVGPRSLPSPQLKSREGSDEFVFNYTLCYDPGRRRRQRRKGRKEESTRGKNSGPWRLPATLQPNHSGKRKEEKKSQVKNETYNLTSKIILPFVFLPLNFYHW